MTHPHSNEHLNVRVRFMTRFEIETVVLISQRCLERLPRAADTLPVHEPNKTSVRPNRQPDALLRHRNLEAIMDPPQSIGR